MSDAIETMVDLLHHQARVRPDAVAFTFLLDGSSREVSWTFAELDQKSRAIAANLRARLQPGERVLLLYPQGLDYLAALFGCMAAGVLAIPLQPPGRHRAKLAVPKLEAIVSDGGVALACTVSGALDEMRSVVSQGEGLADLSWLATDTIADADAADYAHQDLKGEDLAYLQYTSGSTSIPKGVMVSHENLLYNLHDFDDGYGHDHDSVMVSWLPTFHDLGLVYGAFMPVYRGFHGVLLDPLHFLKRPMNWLEAISRFGGTHAPAPNFAFDLCVSKSSPEERAALDLRSWRIALNGAEPIRHETEARFVEAFAAAGVTWQTISHAYGMSESTAVIAKEHVGTDPLFLDVDGAELERHRIVEVPEGTAGARRIAGCGITTNQTNVAIVDPETLALCPDDGVGEIWVGGPTRAKGYWNRAAATRETFFALTSDTQEGPYLRTGDLGFTWKGHVFVTGRLKDMIIIRGENHYPQDIEWSVQYASDAIRPSCVAAFARPLGGVEVLSVVFEVYPDRVADPEQVYGVVRDAVSDHGLQVHEIVMIPPRAIFKTSTGKIMRRKTRLSLDDGTMEVVGRWTRPAVTDKPSGEEEPLAQRLASASEVDRESLLVHDILSRAASMVGLPVDALDPDVPLKELGFDSVQAVELADQISSALGLDLAATVLFEYPTAEEFARYLLDTLAEPGAVAREEAAPGSDDEPADLDDLDEDALAALLAAELDGL